MNKQSPININEYIAAFQEPVKSILEQMRNIIKKAAPKAEEVISYGMPAFKYHSVLVYFAAYTKHIGFYPTPSGIREFQEEISVFKSSKGAVQFPLNKKLPAGLIKKIVKFRVSEVEEMAKLKIKTKLKTQQ